MAIIWSIFNVHSEYELLTTNANWKIETSIFVFFSILPIVPTEPTVLIGAL